ncbi:hypothetical protein GBP45_09965 [Pediococcus acidilactici]|nr:hypothetical protein GBP45_09965 [Pediococcus acidilactici]
MMRNYANEQIDRTARMHFRSDKDINIWLLLELRFVQGDFVPRKTKIGKYYDFDDGKALIKTLKSGKVPLICINDDSKNKKLRDKIKISEEILKVLEEKFSSRSSVEI